MSINKPGFERELQRESLDSITLDQYKGLPTDVQEWLETTEAIPTSVQEKLGTLDPNMSLRTALLQIRNAIVAASEGRNTRPQSFEESRFASFAAIVERGLISCGAHTRAVGATLRSHGIPVRFVDGTHTESDQTHDHAWLDIYVPKTGEWIESDTRTEDFSFGEGNMRKGVFHNWEELRDIEREESEGARLLHELEQTGEYVFHGSTVASIDELRIHQPYDYTNDIKREDGDPCIAATRSADVAIFRALVVDDHTGFGPDDQGNIQLRASQKAIDAARTRKGFVYVLPKKGFAQFGVHPTMEWRSSENQKPVQIIEVNEKDLPKDIELISAE